jgi:hypothetical protein
VAILRTQQDFAIAREQGRYRIPVESAQRILRDRWPPEWLAFYQTKTFGGQAYAVNYTSRITDIDTPCNVANYFPTTTTMSEGTDCTRESHSIDWSLYPRQFRADD